MSEATNPMDEILFLKYQQDTLLEKLIILKWLIDNHERCFGLMEKEIPDKFKDKKAVLNGLKAEIHFTMFHSIEVMLALTLAVLKQPNDVWRWLASYNFNKFNPLVSQIAEGGISSVGNGSEEDTVKEVCFKNADFSKIDLARLQKSVEILSKIFKLAAQELSGKDEYNSYKHGLRLIKGEMKAKLIDMFTSEEKASGEYLMTIQADFKTLPHALKMKTYNWERSYGIARTCCAVTSLIVKQRRAVLEKTPNFNTLEWDKLDVDSIFSFERWQVRISPQDYLRTEGLVLDLKADDLR